MSLITNVPSPRKSFNCDACGKNFAWDELEHCECGKFMCADCLTPHLEKSAWCRAYVVGCNYAD